MTKISIPKDIHEALTPEQRKQRFRAMILGLALLFILMGAGNYCYGYAKGSYYSGLHAKVAKSELVKKAAGKIPFVDNVIRIDLQSEYYQRLQTRIDFYQVVQIGGVCFTYLSLVCFALWLFLSDIPKGHT